MAQIKAVLIAGPTASGKSALGRRLAAALGGAVINADSMQVYRDLRIVTARPAPEEEALAPHRLFGHVDGAINYSAGLWLKDAARALEKAKRQGLLPVIVGGTGLYFKALTQGLSRIPEVPSEIRAAVRARAQDVSVADLHATLMRRDPETAARLRPSDPQRILRALEVLEAAGKGLASFQAARAPPILDAAKAIALFLVPGRQVLKATIDARFDAMLRAGALEEVAVLRERRLDPSLPVMRALGVEHLLAYLAGQVPLAEAARLVKRDTRTYARRQLTFARHQLPLFRWIALEDAEALVLPADASPLKF